MTRYSALEVFGYVEGYYGKLLTWDERASLIDELAAHGFNTYFYGPKDDAKHRLYWRESYGEGWRRAFRLFTSHAHKCSVSVIAGIAPGLDFNFSDFCRASGNSSHSDLDHSATATMTGDYTLLLAKAQQLVDDGADAIGLMMDDIDADFRHRCGEFHNEGAAHAALANGLQQDLEFSARGKTHFPKVFCVPRIYANELLQQTDLTMPAVSVWACDEKPGGGDKGDQEAAEYMHRFTDILHRSISWIYCGTHVVAPQPASADCVATGALQQHRIVIWDNFYANDYCPRRLFLGVWTGREACSELLLNGTGLPHTDRLLLQVVAAVKSTATNQTDNQATNALHAWQQCLLKAGVPEEFFILQDYFAAPVFSDSLSSSGIGNNSQPVERKQLSLSLIGQQIAAIDHLLWRWKAPLAREWYPYLFGLKHDLMIANHTLPSLRIRKTQTPALAGFLENLKTTQDD